MSQLEEVFKRVENQLHHGPSVKPLWEEMIKQVAEAKEQLRKMSEMEADLKELIASYREEKKFQNLLRIRASQLPSDILTESGEVNQLFKTSGQIYYVKEDSEVEQTPAKADNDPTAAGITGDSVSLPLQPEPPLVGTDESEQGEHHDDV